MIIKTINRGLNWSQQSFSVNKVLTDVTFLNPKYGFAVGKEGTIIKTETGGIMAIAGNSNETPSGYFLSQNYPNPFNQLSIINYKCSIAGILSIKVFDIAGKEVRTIVNGFLQPGTYKIAIDASELSSGVYFYRMESGDFTDVKRLVVLK